MRTSILSLSAAFCLMAACSGGDSGSTATTAPTVKANVTYQGVFSSGVERGTVTLTSGSPATGSLKVGTDAAVSLSGTFTAATSTFALSGGGYSVNASPGTGGSLTGTITGTGISGTGTLAALDASTTATPAHYCGIVYGDDAGMIEFFFLGASAVGVHSGMGGSFSLNGSASGSSATLSATKPDKTNTVTVSVTFNGSTLTGTAASTAYPNEKVYVSASVAACGGSAPPTPTATSSYVGYAFNNGVSGLLSVNTGSPASGSLAWNNGGAQALSGTFNATTGALSLSGGGITITGTASAASFSGTVAGLSGSPSTAGAFALASPSSSPVTRYCGGVTGGTAGRLIMLQSDASLRGVFIFGNSSLGVSGSVTGGMAYFTGGTTAYFAGTGANGSFSGTISHERTGAGTWSLSGC